MSDVIATALHDRNPLIDLRPTDVVARWTELGLAHVSDAELIELAAAVLAVPREAAADSFVLHAPLELLARAGLLARVDPRRRTQARQRIAWLAAAFQASGPAHHGAPSSTSVAAALDAGDLDAIDGAVVVAASASTAADLVAELADPIVARLSAAGHGSIFLHLLQRHAGGSAAAAAMARGPLREMGRHPDWKLTWMDERPSDAPAGSDLAAVLGSIHSVGNPGSNFIHPTMSFVERDGYAASVLDGPTRSLSVASARTILLRVAAHSMLQDDPAEAPYGWSHCLTMPQGVLSIAAACSDPGRAIAVAATFVLGFRATQGTKVLDLDWQPEPQPDLSSDDYLAAGPDRAAAALWHASDADRDHFVRELVTMAALHEDAHLAKYTLACLDAARDDAPAARLFLAAAAFLGGWWRVNGSDDELFA